MFYSASLSGFKWVHLRNDLLSHVCFPFRLTSRRTPGSVDNLWFAIFFSNVVSVGKVFFWNRLMHRRWCRNCSCLFTRHWKWLFLENGWVSSWQQQSSFFSQKPFCSKCDSLKPRRRITVSTKRSWSGRDGSLFRWSSERWSSEVPS